MAKGRKTAKSSNFMESIGSSGSGKSNSPEQTTEKILDLLDNHEAAEQNEVLSSVLKKVKQNRLKSVADSQTKLTSTQQDISALDQAINTGLNATLEPGAEA